MSPLAKVFVVVNLILSVVFFGSSATLFTTRTNWREKAIQFRDEANKQIAEVKTLYEKQGGRIVDLNKLLLAANKDLNSSTTDKQKLEVELNEKKTALAQANIRIDNEVKAKGLLQDANTQLEKQKTDLIGVVDTKTKEAEEAKADKLKAVEQFTHMKLDYDKADEELKQTQIAKKETEQKLQSKELLLEAIKKAYPTISTDLVEVAPPINGIIEQVSSKDKLVVLSVGKNQKVQEGYKFTIYRGDHFIGKVQVTKVYEDLAGAKIIFTQENESIQIGDKAATQI